MGLFSKKEKERCPVCGNEMTFFQQTSIEGGSVFICNDCADKLRGQYDLWGELQRDNFDCDKVRFKTGDALNDVTLARVIGILKQREVTESQTLDVYDSTYENIFKVEEVFSISPKPLEVGIFRAKAYKNRQVAKGMMVKGSLTQKDKVTIVIGGERVETEILELIPCDGIDFMENLKANLHKKTVQEGKNAWLVLDVTEDFPQGSVIGK